MTLKVQLWHFLSIHIISLKASHFVPASQKPHDPTDITMQSGRNDAIPQLAQNSKVVNKQIQLLKKIFSFIIEI